MSDFVARHSVVRKIWGDSDTVVLVFAGCAAEFALNRAVDWLFFTGKLPNDPMGRFFATASYAQQIVFAEEDRKSTRLNSSHRQISYAVFCLKKKNIHR